MNNSDFSLKTPEDVSLEEDEVHVWKVGLGVPLNTIGQLQHILSEDEVKRAEQFRFEKDRLHWITAHAILRILLGHYLDSDPRGIAFTSNDYGKPFIAFPSYGIRLRFNLSHSGNLALYAFTYNRHIGVDVEQMRGSIEYETLAQHYFSPYERATLQALPPTVRQEAFFQCWSRKEAYIKARGSGLSVPLDQFDVSLTPGEPAALLDSREDPQAQKRWSLHAISPESNYTGALVVEGTGWHLSCWQWAG